LHNLIENKYLGVLLDTKLSWKFHIDSVALKINRIIGVIARLGHFVPLITLLSIYRYGLSYGLAACGQAAKTHLQKKSLCYKNVSFVCCIFVNPELMLCLCLLPQKFFPKYVIC